MKKVAVASYIETDCHLADEALFIPALRERGISANSIPWNDPSICWKNFDLVVIRSTWDYFEHVDLFFQWLSHLEENAIPVLNPIPLMRWNLNKIYLKELSLQGIPIIPSLFFEKGERVDLVQILSGTGWNEVIIKPLVGANSYHALKFKASDLSDSIKISFQQMVFETGAIVQEFFPEVLTDGEWSFIFVEGKCCQTIKKYPQLGDFRVQETFGGTLSKTVAPPHLYEDAKNVFDSIIKSDYPPLYARVDGLERGGALYLMELELVEPELFLRLDSKTLTALVDGVVKYLH